MASTLLNERGVAPDLIELQLAHKDKDKVRAAYNPAERLTERATLMQSWSDYLDELRAANPASNSHEAMSARAGRQATLRLKLQETGRCKEKYASHSGTVGTPTSRGKKSLDLHDRSSGPPRRRARQPPSRAFPQLLNRKISMNDEEQLGHQREHRAAIEHRYNTGEVDAKTYEETIAETDSQIRHGNQDRCGLWRSATGLPARCRCIRAFGSGCVDQNNPGHSQWRPLQRRIVHSICRREGARSAQRLIYRHLRSTGRPWWPGGAGQGVLTAN
jgi:hypothetical protein